MLYISQFADIRGVTDPTPIYIGVTVRLFTFTKYIYLFSDEQMKMIKLRGLLFFVIGFVFIYVYLYIYRMPGKLSERGGGVTGGFT